MDSNVQVALIGMGGIFITAVSVILVAMVNSRKERDDTADSAVEKTLRERLTLRDEQIADHVADKDDMRARIDEQRALIDEQRVLIAQQTEIIARQNATLQVQEQK
jgi:adenylosuccinate lyase